MNRYKILLLLSLILVFASCQRDESWRKKSRNPELLHKTIRQVTDVIVHDIFSPPVASRIYTYTSIAAYETAIHMDTTRDFVSLAGQLHGLDSIPQPEQGKEYSFALASTQAAFKVGRTLVFSEDLMDEYYEKMILEYKALNIPKDVFERSVEYGNKVAARIIKWSSKDNYKQTRSYPKYSIEEDPATWKPTPPAYMDAVEPHWNKIRTFVLDSAAQFKPARPTPFSTDKKSQFYKEALEVKTIGDSLNKEQKEITFFWDCNPFVMNVKGHVMFATKKISPGGHWINITRVACNKANADFVHTAEAYARVSVSLIEGFISCWDEKYRSKMVRPETYINQYIDENWIPVLQTPPFPEYTSGHSVISSSAAVCLTSLFGDNFSYTDSTEVAFGLTSRSFTSFIEASEEAAVSRIYGGIHYRPACMNGIKQGRAIGEFVVQHVRTRREAVAAN